MKIDKNYYRPAEVELLIGDPLKQKQIGMGLLNMTSIPLLKKWLNMT